MFKETTFRKTILKFTNVYFSTSPMALMGDKLSDTGTYLLARSMGQQDVEVLICQGTGYSLHEYMKKISHQKC